LYKWTIGSIFGGKKEKKTKAPDKIQVPPPEDNTSEDKDQTPTGISSNHKPTQDIKGLDSNEFFANMNLNSAPNNPNEYNPPDLFSGMSLSATPVPKQTTGITQNTMSMGFKMNPPSNNSPFGGQSIFQPQHTSNIPLGTSQDYMPPPINTQGNTQNTLFGLPLSSMNFGGPAPVTKQQTKPNQIQNISNDFINISKDGDLTGLNQTGTTDNSLPHDDPIQEFAPKVEDTGYTPPNLFDQLNISNHNIKPKAEPVSSTKVVKPAENTEELQHQRSAPQKIKGHWDSYKSKAPELPSAGIITDKMQTQNINTIPVAKPHTPINSAKTKNDKILDQNEADFSCSSIHNLSKHSINDEGEY